MISVIVIYIVFLYDEDMNVKRRNNTIDVLKLVFSLCIIGIHLDLNLPFLGNRKINYDSSNRPHLAAGLIEADEVDLEYTDCETVRGVKVHIGPECVVDRVEYSGELTTDPYATVGEKVKI